MNKTPIWLSVCVSLLSILTPLVAQEQQVGEEYKQQEFFNWAWDLPDPDYEKHPITEHYFWYPIDQPLAVGASYSNSRSRRDEDSNTFSFGGVFRPLTFHLSGDTYLAAGITSSFSLQFNQSPELDSETPADAEGQVNNYATGLTFFLSSPEWGAQVTFDFNFYWSRLYNEGDDVAVDVGGGIIVPSVVRFYQRERGFSGFFQLNLLRDALFLYGIDLTVTWSFPIARSEVDLDLEIPGLARIDQDVDEIETGSITSILYVRALAIEVFRNQRITFEPAMGISYFANDHGHGLLTGIRLNVFDMFGVSIFEDWQFNNDVSDKFIVTVDFGFLFGKRVSNRPQTVFNSL